MAVFGPTFGVELAAAGVAAGVSWDPNTGVVTYDPSLSTNYIVRVQQVIAAHNPNLTVPISLSRDVVVSNMHQLGVLDAFSTALFSSTLTLQVIWNSLLVMREDNADIYTIMTSANPPIYPYTVFSYNYVPDPS